MADKAQEIRDKHYKEDGVDEFGHLPEAKAEKEDDAKDEPKDEVKADEPKVSSTSTSGGKATFKVKE